MTILITIALILIFLCWGSFLNVLAFRFIHGYSVGLSRSFCPTCRTQLHWYDLIPLLSWLILRCKCRTCASPISYLYPVIELLTAGIFTGMFFYIPPNYFIGYTIFFSALIISIRSDLETMLISRFTTVFIIPVAFMLSTLDLLPIGLGYSFWGAIFGYGILWATGKLFYALKNMQGLGDGDAELLAMIGAYTGPMGVWVALIISSLLGTILGIILYLRGTINTSTKIPFGPLLAAGALCYSFAHEYLVQLLF